MIANIIGLVVALATVAACTVAAHRDDTCSTGFGLIAAAFLWLAFIECLALAGEPWLYGHWLRPILFRVLSLAGFVVIVISHGKRE